MVKNNEKQEVKAMLSETRERIEALDEKARRRLAGSKSAPKANILFDNSIQDGKLSPATGRIVIYNDFIEISHGPSRDHNDLLRALAAKYRLPKDVVISDAIRLYWDRKGDDIVVCPVRKLDEGLFCAREEFHKKLIWAWSL